MTPPPACGWGWGWACEAIPNRSRAAPSARSQLTAKAGFLSRTRYAFEKWIPAFSAARATLPLRASSRRNARRQAGASFDLVMLDCLSDHRRNSPAFALCTILARQCQD